MRERASRWTAVVASALVALATGWCGAAESRAIPVPLEGHPGNVFLAGEAVTVSAPEGVSWRALDERGKVAGSGPLDSTGGPLRTTLGTLPVGWYRIEFLNGDGAAAGWTTAAVLERLKAPIPEDSPICVDAALSWLSEDEAERATLARLAALAGVNWIRDRIHWREMQTGPGTFVPETKYDAAAAMQAREGLQVLQVFHTLPKWVMESAPDGDPRCPDLRQVYAFCKAMAARFSGKVSAWEPWNEGNAANFGGWTIDGLCAYQKAAFLGFKAGDPAVTVGWNPLGGINSQSLVNGILANETWPYYDTYNLHSYDWPHAYETLWGPAREAACGRPIWVTECDRGIEAEAGSAAGDLSPENNVLKAELVAQEVASSLYAGASRHYHFVLGHYMENRTQFGLLRKDLTPRPSYVALAAAGRLLADARCLGRWNVEGQPNAYAVAFRGPERDVLVAWIEEQVDWPQRGRAKAAWALPEGMRVEAAFDYLGRPLAGTPEELCSAAVYLVLPKGEADKLTLAKPAASAYREGAPANVVLQLQWPQAQVSGRTEGWTQEHDCQAAPASETAFRVYVYNFGSAPAKGALAFGELPEGWSVAPSGKEVEVAPMERARVDLRLRTPANAKDERVRVMGDFGAFGKAALSFRVRTAE
ncbi:MAG: hypothetical protein RBU21_00705 [FCB group bacterium]|jgi:hypothetical protein|nr:hypothetical protein [FCB group bacterium]